MPTKKPIIQVVMEEDRLELFKRFCKEEGRSVSNMARHLIDIYIAEQMLKSIPTIDDTELEMLLKQENK